MSNTVTSADVRESHHRAAFLFSTPFGGPWQIAIQFFQERFVFVIMVKLMRRFEALIEPDEREALVPLP